MYIQALVGLTQLCILTQPSLASFPGPGEKLPLTIDTWEIFFCKLSLIPSFFLLPSFIPQSILLSPHPLQAVNLSASFYLSYCKVLFECIYIFLLYILCCFSLYCLYSQGYFQGRRKRKDTQYLKSKQYKTFLLLSAPHSDSQISSVLLCRHEIHVSNCHLGCLPHLVLYFVIGWYLGCLLIIQHV